MSISIGTTPAMVLALLMARLNGLDPKTVTYADIQAAIAEAQEMMP